MSIADNVPNRIEYQIEIHHASSQRTLYVLLDVDGSLPRRLSTPTRDPYCSNPPDDFDD